MESVRPCSAFPVIQDILKGCPHTHHLPGLCRVLRASVCMTTPFCPVRSFAHTFEPGSLWLQGCAFSLSRCSSQCLLRSSWTSPTANAFRHSETLCWDYLRDLSTELSFY